MTPDESSERAFREFMLDPSPSTIRGTWDTAIAHERKQRDEWWSEQLHDIVQWTKAYPLSVFPEPDMKRAHEILKQHGMTLDAISASNMRHVLEGLHRIAKDALAAMEELK